MRGPTALTTSLATAQHHEAGAVGRKAAALSKVASAGFAVPEGVVLLAEAFSTARRAAGLGPGATPAEVLALALPREVEEALDAVVQHLGEGPLAVRSSAPDEDHEDASFAGQYESVLDVTGREALADAVKRCWASACTEQMRVYREATGRSASIDVAVLIQRLVEPDVAGVAFSANPVTGARDEVVVSAVLGQGSALVEGHVTPDEWCVRGATVVATRATQQALAEAQVRGLAALARKLEALFGAPQDVEWAMAGGNLLVLQARPITAVPVKPAAELPAGSWTKDAARFAEPVSVFGAALIETLLPESMSAMYREFGALPERFEARVVGGEVYTRVVPPGGREGSPPPWWLLAVVARVAPPLRRRLRAAKRQVRDDVLLGLVDRWEQQWRPEVQGDTARLRERPLGDLSDVELADHLDDILELARRCFALHFRLLPPHVVYVHELAESCAELLGWSPGEALQLLAGLSSTTSAASGELAELGAAITRDAGARAELERPGRGLDDLAARIGAVDVELGARLERWSRTFGLQTVNDDPGSPTLNERPWLVAGLLRAAGDAAARRADGRAGAARGETLGEAQLARARAALRSRPEADRQRFEEALARAQRAYPVREDVALWATSIPCGLARTAMVEAGRRLAARGALGSAGDAVHLQPPVLLAALRGDDAGDLAAAVHRARAERAWVRARPGPLTVGPSAGVPDVRGLPRPARRLNAAMLWSLAVEAEQVPAARGPGEVLRGIPACPGSHRGPVRVVRGERDFERVLPGDVLVCHNTDPAWAVLFGTVGALVTDAGGVLSHAAIVAREHGIPAVLATGGATGLLADGEIVVVDGGSGKVGREQN